MKKTLFFFLLITSFAFSQNFEGVVKDKFSGEPLQGVHISSSGILSNTYSDEEGKYRVAPKGNISPQDSIFFSSVGYRTEKFSFGDLKLSGFEVLLTPTTEELKEVNVNTGKALKPSLKFTELAQMEKGVYDFASVLIEGKIYVIAGNASFTEDPIQDEVNKRMGMVTLEDIVRASWRDFSLEEYSDKVQVYNIEEDEWGTASIPVRKRAGHTAVLHENKIYILGGKNWQNAGRKELIDNKIEILDLEKDTLLIDHANPHRAIDAAAFTYNENLMILGGSVRVNKIGNKIFSNEVHLFNLQSGLWFNAGKMTTGKETVVVRVEDELFLIGGNDGGLLSDIEVLNLKTGRWEQRSRLPRALKDPAVTTHNGIIYIYEKANFFTYNTRTGELHNFKIDLNLEGPGLQYSGGKIYLFGGYEGNDYSQSPVANCYSIDLEEFETTAVLSYSRR